MSLRSAFIDIGTNTILCLVAELREGGRFRVLKDMAEITRLGEGVDQTSTISAEAEQRSLETLERYLCECKNLGVDDIVAVGTSALRDARNSGEVRQRFEQRLGLQVRVISGPQEAAYSFLAVRKGLNVSADEWLVIDIGGGSTEFIRGNASGMSQTLSIDLGSVRLTERYLRSDPVKDREFAQAVAAIDTEIAPLCDGILHPCPGMAMVGIAGTFTTLAAVQQGLVRYSHDQVHGHRLALAEIRRQTRLYRNQSIAGRKAIAGMEPKRADVILAGALLIERIMTLTQTDVVTVSDQGVRYGLLYERLAKPLFC